MLVVGTGATLTLWAATPAHALDNSAAGANSLTTGVWWRAETGTAALPAPPQVPAHGLWVSSDATGPSAISAVRFTLPDAARASLLTLHVAKLTAPLASGPGLIRACVVTHAWATPATSPGDWAARPSYDCAKGSVPGRLSPDLTTVAFDLRVLPAADYYDFVIVPGPAGPPAFDVTFEPVKPGDVSVLPIPAPPPTAEPTLPAAVPPTATPPADAAVGPAPLAALGAPEAPFAAAPVAAPLAATEILPLATHPSAGPVATVAATSGTQRLLAALVFCALAAWASRLLTAADTSGVDGTAGREPLTLYDAPAGNDPRRRPRLTAGDRTGAPPTLR